MKKSYFNIQTMSLAAGIAALVVLFFFAHLIMPVSFDEEFKEIEIPAGSSYTGALNILERNGIIKDYLPFMFLARLTASTNDLKPGYYNLSASMSPLEIFDKLIKGKVVQFAITIPEGTTLLGFKRKLERAGLIDEISWQLVYDKDFLASMNIDAPSLEGYLYPDTYNFSKGADPRLVFRIMVQRMRELFDEPLRQRAAELGRTEKEVLTLASIIEKEAAHDSERPLISAVYNNRLKKNMRLQADPTVLYGIRRKWRRIRYKDLRRSTPYNTYKMKGLPLGPIASPGIKSIKAALYPADVDYLFFVSMNNGLHHFSYNGRDHVKAVEQYQINGYNKADNDEKKIN